MAELARERRLLGVAEDERTIRTVFSWSVRQLDDDCRSVFRLLGLHPGRQYDTGSVAALASVDEVRAGRLLDALVRVHLVEASADGRFGMHDLLAAYARELAEEIEPEAAGRAFSRLFEYYSRGAGHAAATIDRATADVRAWFEAERLNLEVVAQHGAQREVHATRLGAYEHDLAMLNRAAGDIPRALQYFHQARKTYGHSAADHIDRIQLDQAETMIAAGIHSEACALFDDLRARLRHTGTPLLLARLDRHQAIAELARGDAARAARLAEAAHARFTEYRDQRAAAICALTHLAASTTEPDRLTDDERSATYQLALSTSAELTRAGLRDEADFARLLGVRLVIANGDLDLATALMPTTIASSHAPIEYWLLRQLCWAEIAMKRDKVDDVLFEAETAFDHVDRVGERSTGLSPVPIGAFYSGRLRDLALDVVVRRQEPGALLDFTERARVQRLKYAPEREGTTPHAITLDQVVHAIGERALVSFVTAGDRLFALVVTDADVRVVGLGTTEVAFEQARRLHADINAMAPDHLPPVLAKAIAKSAERLADHLDALFIRPLATHIADRELVVVPTGLLYSVAWSALATLRGRSVVVAPSVTAWLSAERASPRPRRTRVVFASGPGLTSATAELDMLARFHSDPVVISTSHASVTEVLKAFDGADVVHIAAHGEHEPENALFSRLELIDGPLFAHQFSGLRQPPQQVVLAACELAGNHIAPGDDALGFADALLAAGVGTVIVSISRVWDEVTASTMRDYHQALAAGHSPAQALAKAVAVDPLRRPFICVGSGRA